jgi:hypothetical protein
MRPAVVAKVLGFSGEKPALLPKPNASGPTLVAGQAAAISEVVILLDVLVDAHPTPAAEPLNDRREPKESIGQEDPKKRILVIASGIPPAECRYSDEVQQIGSRRHCYFLIVGLFPSLDSSLRPASALATLLDRLRCSESAGAGRAREAAAQLRPGAGNRDQVRRAAGSAWRQG